MTRLQANSLLLLTAVIWGTTFVVQQVGTGGLQTLTFTGTRMLVGALFVMPLAVRQFLRVHRHERRFDRRDWLGIVITGMILFCGSALQQYGIFHTTVTNAGFLTALYVPLVPIIARLLFKRTVHWSVWPGSCCCLVGTYIMSGAQGLALSTGDFWVIASSFFWSFHVIMVGIMAIRTRAPLAVACGQFAVCGVLGLITGIMLEHPQPVNFSDGLFGILYAGLLSTGVGFTLQVVGQRFTREADAAIILSSETVFAAVSGGIFLGERLGLGELSGGLLIFLGIMMVQLMPMCRRTVRPLSQ